MSDVTKLMMKVKELTNAIQSLDTQTITKDQLRDALEFVGISENARGRIVNRAFLPEQNELTLVFGKDNLGQDVKVKIVIIKDRPMRLELTGFNAFASTEFNHEKAESLTSFLNSNLYKIKE